VKILPNVPDGREAAHQTDQIQAAWSGVAKQKQAELYHQATRRRCLKPGSTGSGLSSPTSVDFVATMAGVITHSTYLKG